MTFLKHLSLSILTLSLLLLGGCGVYNFTGGVIPDNVKTISIPVFYNESSSGPPNMSQIFTEQLKGYYQSNSKLAIVRESGDWQLSGYISGYVVTPLAPKANETSSLSRLTITVKVDFLNTKDDLRNFSQNFSFYGDFQQSQSLSSVENKLIEEIFTQIILDIFTKTTSDW